MARVRLLDVAAEAGVSRATASRVLAGTARNVHPDLARRVHDASARLGYRTDAAARALRTRTTRTVGVLVPSLRNPYFVNVVGALSAELSGNGGSLLLAESADDPAVEAQRIETLLGSFVDALIVVPTSWRRSGAAIAHAARWTRIVQVDRCAEGAEVPFVGIDNVAAMRLMVEHLHARGRRRILYLGAEQEASTGSERADAFRAIAGRAAPELILPRFTVDAGHDAARQLLASGNLPDAVLCAADVLAVGLASTLQRSGVRVPHDLAVTAFDDTDLLELVNPAITTVQHPVEQIARTALQLLETDPADEAAAQQIRMEPGIRIRAST